MIRLTEIPKHSIETLRMKNLKLNKYTQRMPNVILNF